MPKQALGMITPKQEESPESKWLGLNAVCVLEEKRLLLFGSPVIEQNTHMEAAGVTIQPVQGEHEAGPLVHALSYIG